jgi:hypothetical protein
LLAGHEIVEIPIHYEPRTYEEGKKIKSKDGIKAVFIMLRDRLGFSPVFRKDGANRMVNASNVEHIA